MSRGGTSVHGAAKNRREPRGFIASIFFLSGAAALIYEISWVRLFSVLFGNSTHAIAVVVAIFMTGLALGSYLSGRLLRNIRANPLRMYGGIELGVGVSGALVPTLLRAAEPLIAGLYSGGAPSLSELTLARSLITAAVLMIPTALMGATLPVLSQHVITRLAQVGTRVGLLYGLNTLGSVAGCALTGIVLIRDLGATRSSYLASSLSVLVGLVAILMPTAGTRTAGVLRHDEGGRGERESAATSVSGRKRHVWLPSILLVFFVSGFAALSYELIWTRILGFLLQSGTSTYAFTIILTVFLTGLGAGALILSSYSSQLRDGAAAFGSLQMLIGGSALASLLFYAQLDARGFPQVPPSYWATDFLKAAVLMSIPTLLMGISFPLGCRLVTESRATVGQNVGRAYAFNLLGSVAGPLATGFLLLPRLGSEGTLYAMVIANILTGLLILSLSPSAQGRQLLKIVPVATIVFLASVRVAFPNLVLRLVNTGRDPVVYFKEESSGSLLATQLKDGVHLIIGGSVGAGSTPIYQRTDELLAYLPLLLHPDPRHVAVICFGTGRTTGLFAQHASVEAVDVVEIAQGAFDAGRDLFESFNLNALSNPKVHPVLDDGFNYVKYASTRYDVISIDPFTPRDPGSARLYTRDFLQFVKARLNPGGVVVMWAFPPRVRIGSFQVALKTFQTVFPNTTVWLSPVDQHVLFVATPDPLLISVPDLANRLAARPTEARYPYHITDVVGFLNLFFLDQDAVRSLASREVRESFTVERPNLEFLYLTDRSEFLDAEWRRRMASSVLPRLRGVPPDFQAALSARQRAVQ